MRRTKRRRQPVRRSKTRLIILLMVILAAFYFSDDEEEKNKEKIFNQATYHVVGAPISSGEVGVTPTTSFLKQLFFVKEIIAENRPKNYVPLAQISADLCHAMVAVEDSRFYTHHGFDWEGILRAAFVNVKSGEIEEGASTITQQLVKNLLLSPEQTFGRKAEEIVLAVVVEENFSKDEILEMYLNSIYFGSNFYGIAAASEGYFGKNPAELNLAEAAMLAGLPNAPSLYSPYVDFMLAKKRQIIVLDAMEKRGFIDRKAAADAKIQPLYLVRKID